MLFEASSLHVFLLTRAPPADASVRVNNPGVGALDLYLFFNVFPAHLALPLLIASLCLARARRNLTLLNMAVTWIIVGVVSCMLLYAGRQTGPEPPQLLCLAQASLLYAVPPMVSTSVLALVFQVWSGLAWKPGEKMRGVMLSVILVIPYVVYFGFAVIGSVIGTHDPALVTRRRRFFYCSIQSRVFSTVVAMFSALLLVITTVLEVWIGVVLYRNRRSVKQRMRMTEENAQSRGLGADDVQFAVRVSIFGVYIFLGLTLTFVSIVAPNSAVPDLFMASIGSAVVVVFGTQPRLWAVWRDVFRHGWGYKTTHIPTLSPYPGAGAELNGQELELPPPVARSGKSPLITPRSSYETENGDFSQVITVPARDEKAALRGALYSERDSPYAQLASSGSNTPALVVTPPPSGKSKFAAVSHGIASGGGATEGFTIAERTDNVKLSAPPKAAQRKRGQSPARPAPAVFDDATDQSNLERGKAPRKSPSASSLDDGIDQPSAQRAQAGSPLRNDAFGLPRARDKAPLHPASSQTLDYLSLGPWGPLTPRRSVTPVPEPHGRF